MKTKKEKLKQNNLSSKKNRVANQNNKKKQKNLEIEAEKKHDAEKTFLRSKKTFFCETNILLA